MVLILIKETPFTSYGWINSTVGAPTAVTVCSDCMVPLSPLPVIDKVPALPDVWVIPEYEITSSEIKAYPASTIWPSNLANTVVLATETTVSFNPTLPVRSTFSLSGETSTISILLFPPWWAWLYCLILKTFPVNLLSINAEFPLIVAPELVLVASLLGFV